MRILLLLFIAIGSASFGQTKKIFHKSHSGSSGSMFMDDKNNFGPGMAPVRYRTPVSKIKLNYLITVNNNQYPLVSLDTASKTMRFFDLKDSLIGCDRDYREYLNHGSIVYDVLTNHFFVYQRYDLKTNTQVFLVVTDSIDAWESRKLIRRTSSFIRDGNNHRILTSYPMLDHTLTRQLVPSKIDLTESFPVIVDEDIKKNERKKSRKERREERKKTKKSSTHNNVLDNDEELELTPVLYKNTPNNGSLIRWVIFSMLAFSLFVFIGVKQIVKEEVSKIKKR